VQGKADAEERKRMAMQIPGLLQKIRAGLDSIGVTPETRAPFLDACLAMQTAVLRGKAASAEALAVDALVAEALTTGEMGDADAGVAGVLEMEGLTLKLVRPKTPGMETAEDFADDVTVGDWLDFRLPDGNRCCGRVCWLSPVMGNPLLANPEWEYAISMARPLLDRQLTLGRALPAGAGSFFDRAAESALRRGA